MLKSVMYDDICACRAVDCSQSRSCTPSNCHYGCAGADCLEPIFETLAARIVSGIAVTTYVATLIYALLSFRKFLSRSRFRMNLHFSCVVSIIFDLAGLIAYEVSYAMVGPNCTWVLALWSIPFIFVYFAILSLITFYLQIYHSSKISFEPIRRRVILLVLLYACSNIFLFILSALNLRVAFSITFAAVHSTFFAILITLALYLTHRVVTRPGRSSDLSSGPLLDVERNPFFQQPPPRIRQIERRIKLFCASFIGNFTLYIAVFCVVFFHQGFSTPPLYIFAMAVFNFINFTQPLWILSLLLPSPS